MLEKSNLGHLWWKCAVIQWFHSTRGPHFTPEGPIPALFGQEAIEQQIFTDNMTIFTGIYSLSSPKMASNAAHWVILWKYFFKNTMHHFFFFNLINMVPLFTASALCPSNWLNFNERRLYVKQSPIIWEIQRGISKLRLRAALNLSNAATALLGGRHICTPEPLTCCQLRLGWRCNLMKLSLQESAIASAAGRLTDGKAGMLWKHKRKNNLLYFSSAYSVTPPYYVAVCFFFWFWFFSQYIHLL